MKRSGFIKRKTRLNPISAKRRKERKIYMEKRAAFLDEHPVCQAAIKILGLDEALVRNGDGYYYANGKLNRLPRSVEIHHVKGRHNGNYLNTDSWLAISREMHEAIHRNPKWARENGLLA